MSELLRNLETSYDPKTKIDCLQNLSQIILLSGDRFARQLDYRVLIGIIEKIINSSESTELLNVSIRCLQNMIQSAPRLSSAIRPLSKAIFRKLVSNSSNNEMVEVIIDLIEILTRDQNRNMLKDGAIGHVIKVFPKCRVIMQQKIVETIASMVRDIPSHCDQMVIDCIPDLNMILQNKNPRILDLSLLSLIRIKNSFLGISSGLKHQTQNHIANLFVHTKVFRSIAKCLSYQTRQNLSPFIVSQLINMLSDIILESGDELVEVSWKEGIFPILDELMDPKSLIEQSSRLEKKYNYVPQSKPFQKNPFQVQVQVPVPVPVGARVQVQVPVPVPAPAPAPVPVPVRARILARVQDQT